MVDSEDVEHYYRDIRRIVIGDMIYGTTISVKIMLYTLLNNIVVTNTKKVDQLALLAIVKEKLIEHSRYDLISEVDFFCLSRGLIVHDDIPLLSDVVEYGSNEYATH